MPGIEDRLAELRAKQRQARLEELRNKAKQALLQGPAHSELIGPPAPVAQTKAPVDPRALRDQPMAPKPTSTFVPEKPPEWVDNAKDAVSDIAIAVGEKAQSLVNILNGALPGKPVSTIEVTLPGGSIGFPAKGEPVKYTREQPPVAPVVVEGEKTKVVEGTKKLVEYLQLEDVSEPLSIFATAKQQLRAREILDGFGGNTDMLHSRIRMIAKNEGKGSNWISKTFNDIMNVANAIEPGAKVSANALEVRRNTEQQAPSSDPGSIPARKQPGNLLATIDPTSVAEGAQQFVIGATSGTNLKADPTNERAKSIGKTAGQVAQIAINIGSGVSLGKTIATGAKSQLWKNVGGALANPNTNPIPDAVLAATAEDGDKFKTFLTGYAINLVAGKILDKNGLSLIVDMPGSERKALKGHMEDMINTYQNSERLKKFNLVPDADIARAEDIILAIDNVDIVDLAKVKRLSELKARIEKATGKTLPTTKPVVKEATVVRVEVPKPKKYSEMTDDDFVDFEPTSAVFDNIDELNLALKDKRIPLKGKKNLPKPETQTIPLDELPKTSVATVEDVTQTNGKRGIFQREKKISLDPAFDKARAAVKALGKPTLHSIRNAFVKQVVDISGNLKRELRAQGESGQLVVDRMEQALGASGKAKMRYETAMEDIFGKDIKSQNRKNLVSDVINARRTILVDKLHPGIKHGDDIDPVRLKTRLAYLEQSEPEAFKQANDAADRYFNQMSSLLEDRYKAGLIDKGLYESLKGDIYSPRVFLSHMNDSHAGLSSTLGESESGLKRILDGSDSQIVNDMEYLMARSITSAERQIASNNAGKEMYNLLKTGEAGDLLVELSPIYGKKKQITGYVKPPKGYDAVSVMIDGKKVQYGMKSDMASEFILKDPWLAPEVAKWARIASGNNLLKFNATQASTDFPLANVFRDVGTIMFANKEYSNFIPYASAQLGVDMASVFKDAVTRKGRVIDMMNQGGSMDFLMATADTWSIPGKNALAGQVRGVVDGLRWLGETSELMTRLALRERALKNFLKQGIPLADAEVKATLAARRYMDFGQGGATVKTLDNVMPYFNAAIQGHRAWIRGAKNDPLGFTSKIMQVGGASAALTTYNIVNHEEAYDAIPDRIKTTNWVFPTSHFRVDENGVKEWMYYSMPKPPGISAAFSVFEATAEAAQGRKVPYQQILMGIDDFMGIGSVPPTLAAALAILGNVDSYTWEQIYKGGREIEKTAEITKNTPEWAIRAGEITGQSPEAIRTAKSKFFTYRNGWVDASAATIDYAYSKMTNQEINETSKKLADPEGAPGLRRFVRFTSSEVSRNKLGDDMRAFNTRRKKQRLELDKIITDGGDAKTFIDSQPKEDQESLRQRSMNFKRNADIPKHFIDINSIASASPTVKAGAMFREWENAPDIATQPGEITKKQIDEYTHRIIGMGSPEFLKMYNFYKSESKAN